MQHTLLEASSIERKRKADDVEALCKRRELERSVEREDHKARLAMAKEEHAEKIAQLQAEHKVLVAKEEALLAVQTKSIDQVQRKLQLEEEVERVYKRQAAIFAGATPKLVGAFKHSSRLHTDQARGWCSHVLCSSTGLLCYTKASAMCQRCYGCT